jgi:hypothetical protein
MVCRPTSANAIELQRVSRTTRALLLMPTAAKPPSLLIPASLPTLSVTRTNTILPLDHPSSLTPTPMCSQLRSAFPACKVFKSPKSEASYHRLHPIYCSPFCFLSGKGRGWTAQRYHLASKTEKVIRRMVWFPYQLNNDASAPVAILSGLLNVESEVNVGERVSGGVLR